MTDTANLYPSTFDVQLPPIAGGGDPIGDPVLDTLEAALKRIRRSWTAEHYLAKSGAVCALGAVITTDLGKKRNKYALISSSEKTIAELIEKHLSDTAKEAIELLNKSAVALYPESENYDYLWQGPLEYINQELDKQDVIIVYKKAIEDRQQAYAS